MKKRAGLMLLLAGLTLAVCAQISASAANIIEVSVDGQGGTFHTSRGMDLFDLSTPVEKGKPLFSVWSFEDPTCVDKDFTGWYAYDASGTQLAGTGLMTTAEILNKPIGQETSFVAQWTEREGYPVTAITYAAFYNGLGEPDYNVKVTLVNNGVRYSGRGSVTIREEIYSQWTGDVQVIWELPGEYVDGNGRWNPNRFETNGPVRDFVREGSCYISVSKTGKEQERQSDRRTVNEFYYSVRNAEPEISRTVDESANSVTAEAGILPEGHSMQTQQHQSGTTYDRAEAAAQAALGTANIQVFDITLKDAAGESLHQLEGFVEVKMKVPDSYTVQEGNTVAVYYLAEDGSGMEACETEYCAEDPADRYVTFKTNHFSVYVFAEVTPEPEPEPEPEPVAPPEPVQPAPEPEKPAAEPEVPAAPPAEELPAEKSDGMGLYVGLGAAAVLLAIAAVAVLKKRR